MFLISGAGISGLLISKLLIKDGICKPEQILVVEKTNSCGGLYKPWICPNLGELDKGMHIYYETLIDKVDSIFYNSLPKDEWIFLENNYKDIAGAYFNGRLQCNSPYPDFRHFTRELKDELITDFFNNLDILKRNNKDHLINKLFSGSSAQEYWINRFGQKVYEKIFNPICKKLYGFSADNLSVNAAYYVRLDRIVLFCSDLIKEIYKSSFLRKVLAYPDQLTMPAYRTNNQRGLYPKSGMLKVVNALYEDLKNLGVNFMMNSSVKEICENGKQFEVKIQSKINNNSLTVDYIFWSGSRASLEEVMHLKNNFIPDKGLSNYYFFRINKQDLIMPDLYYFYCLDPKYSAFRITNFSQYSKNFDSKGRSLICLEEHFSDKQLIKYKNALSISNFSQKLLEMGIIKKEINKEMIKLYKISKRIFPIPLLLEDKLNNQISRLDNISNIIFPGKNKMPSMAPFFLVDTLKDIYEQYEKLVDKEI